LAFQPESRTDYPGARPRGSQFIAAVAGSAGQDERVLVLVLAGGQRVVVGSVVEPLAQRVVGDRPVAVQCRAGVMEAVDRRHDATRTRDRAVLAGGDAGESSSSGRRRRDEDDGGEPQHGDGRSGLADGGDAAGRLVDDESSGGHCGGGHCVDDGRRGCVDRLDGVVSDAECRRQDCGGGDEAETDRRDGDTCSAESGGWAHWWCPFWTLVGHLPPCFLWSPKSRSAE
jgi:hypothetical protein